MTVPALVGVKVTLQLEVVVLTLARVHGDPVNEPIAVPPLVNATVPRGADAVPAREGFITHPVELMTCATTTVGGLHKTGVAEDLRFTVPVFLAVAFLAL